MILCLALTQTCVKDVNTTGWHSNGQGHGPWAVIMAVIMLTCKRTPISHQLWYMMVAPTPMDVVMSKTGGPVVRPIGAVTRYVAMITASHGRK